MASFTYQARFEKQGTHSLLLPLLIMLPMFILGCGTLSPNGNSIHRQKGKLAWPTEGTITRSFGTETNPAYGTKVHNPGIWISTKASSEVKSVRAGEVSKVYTMPEFGRVITINHGEYVSLYGNLSLTHVSEGMSVEEGQLIGMSGTADEPNGESIFFALFVDGVESDPELWLASEPGTSQPRKPYLGF